MRTTGVLAAFAFLSFVQFAHPEVNKVGFAEWFASKFGEGKRTCPELTVIETRWKFPAAQMENDYKAAVAQNRPCDAANFAYQLSQYLMVDPKISQAERPLLVASAPTIENKIVVDQKNRSDAELLEPVDIFSEVVKDAAKTPPAPEVPLAALHWAEETVAQLLAAHDYRNAGIYGIRSLKTLQVQYTDRNAEPIRFMILIAVYTAAKDLGPQADAKWLNWALGMSSDRYTYDGRVTQFKLYLQDFPNAPRDHAARITACGKDLSGLAVPKGVGLNEIAIEHVLVIAKTQGRENPLSGFIAVREMLDTNREYTIHLKSFPKLIYTAIEYQSLTLDFLKKHPDQDKWTAQSFQLAYGLPVAPKQPLSELIDISRVRALKLRELLIKEAKSTKENQRDWAYWAKKSESLLK